MQIRKLKNKNGSVLSNADVCRLMRKKYDDAYNDWKSSGVVDPFQSPLGGKCDEEILAFCDEVLKQPNAQEQENYFRRHLLGVKEFIK